MVNTQKSSVTISGRGVAKGFGIGSIFWIFIVLIIGYFQYGSIEGALATLVLGTIYYVSMALALIPIVGMVAFWALHTFGVEPAVYSWHVIGPSFFQSAMFWVTFTIGIIVNIIVSVLVLAFLADRR